MFRLKQIKLKAGFIIQIIFILFLSTNRSFSQEQKNLKSYIQKTGNSFLQDGYWLKKDRKRQNEVWKNANSYNLSLENGYTKYNTICQIRDFYLWFDFERKRLGQEMNWIGIAAIAAGQLSLLDNGFIRLLLVRNKEVVKFADEGSKKVLEFAFPLLRNVYFSNNIITGKDAENWDLEYGKVEQCVILDSLYKKLSPVAQGKLDKMAGGKGLFSLGVPKALQYTGSIEDCQARFEHGINIMIPYYLAHKKNTNRFMKK